MVPTPLAAAEKTVAKRPGLSAEALPAVLDANEGFREDPVTTPTHQLDSMHELSRASPVLMGSPSSTRKSQLLAGKLTSPRAPLEGVGMYLK